ncbi:MAG: hypothetical protein Q7T68_04795 [Sphingopyxis sp.]|nr:hypothetical protein [Sphingopyxis sp.]
MMHRGILLPLFLSMALLSACGDAGSTGDGGLLDAATLAEQLPPEVRSAVTSYERDLLGAAASYKAEFGHLPVSFADIASVAGARAAAANVLADGIGEQIPFASRETAEKTANAIIGAAERRILDQMKAQDAQN